MLHRWRLDVGNANRGVVTDKLITSFFSVDIIIFTSTKSEHSDSPCCEPITPLFSFFRDSTTISEAKKHAFGRSIIHGGGGQTKGNTENQNRVLTIDACG